MCVGFDICHGVKKVSKKSLINPLKFPEKFPAVKNTNLNQQTQQNASPGKIGEQIISFWL